MWFHETLKVLKSSSTIGKYTGHVIMYADIPFDTELRLVFSSTRLVGQSEHFSENIKVAMIISQKIMLKLIILFLKDIQKLFLNQLTNHFYSSQAVTSSHIFQDVFCVRSWQKITMVTQIIVTFLAPSTTFAVRWIPVCYSQVRDRFWNQTHQTNLRNHIKLISDLNMIW